jgi:hypothetical protein
VEVIVTRVDLHRYSTIVDRHGVEASESELGGRLAAIVRAMAPLMKVLSVARRLCLPDWLVFSGAVYQPVLNHLTGI